MPPLNITRSLGALLLGGLYASLLSGFVFVQVVVYYKMYPDDNVRLKMIVLTIWMLDTFHTVLIWLVLWNALIENYGNLSKIDVISWNIGVGIIVTAVITFLVHIFLARRIFILSKKSYFIAPPIVVLSLVRLTIGCASGAEMLHYGNFPRFRAHIKWVFTCGLILSAVIDVVIAVSLSILLYNNRTVNGRMNVILDTLIKHSFETGSLTCAGSVICVACWLALPHTLVAIGVYFFIAKFYANSLLVTLNVRKEVRNTPMEESAEYTMPLQFNARRRHTSEFEGSTGSQTDGTEVNDTQNLPISIPRVSSPENIYSIAESGKGKTLLEVNVERSVHIH